MKKNYLLNLKLIKSLTISDFLLIEQKKLKNEKNCRFKNLHFFPLKKNTFIYLEPLEIIKSLKQLIRTFNFIKQQHSLKINLHFFTDEQNAIFFSLLKQFLNNKFLKSNILFNYNTNNVENLKQKFKFNLSFLLDKKLSNDKNFLKKQFYRNNFIFFKINSNIELNQNSYKIYNNFDDYKKTLFFISFLRQLLKKTKHT